MPHPRTAAALAATFATVATAVVAAAAPAAATKTVKVNDNFFSPKALTVAKGTTVRFQWVASGPHNVVGSGAATFKSPYRTSGSYSVKLKKAGTVSVLCQIHAGMTMRIKVK